jgi:hypothetical protein
MIFITLLGGSVLSMECDAAAEARRDGDGSMLAFESESGAWKVLDCQVKSFQLRRSMIIQKLWDFHTRIKAIAYDPGAKINDIIQKHQRILV